MRVNSQPKFLIAAILIAVLAVGGLQLALVPIRNFDPDEFQHLHSAWCISKGMLPYKDYFEHHPPFLHFMLAPWLHFFHVETDPDQAISFIFLARYGMWILTGVIFWLTFTLGKRVKNPRVAWLGTLFLATTLMFLRKCLEIRPDVLATLLWLACLLCVIRGMRREGRSLWSFAWSGFFLGLGVMCTQKMLFAIPGLAATMGWYLWRQKKCDNPKGQFWILSSQIAGFCLPVVIILGYIAMRQGLFQFIDYNFIMNLDRRIRFAPYAHLNLLFSQSPLLVVFGIAGFLRIVSNLFPRESQGNHPGRESDVLLALNTLGLLAGLFLNPAPHRQSFLPVLPLLAILASISVTQMAHTAVEWKGGTGLRIRSLAFEGVALLIFILAKLWMDWSGYRSGLVEQGFYITMMVTPLLIGMVMISGRWKKWVVGIVLVAQCAYFLPQMKEMFQLRNQETLSELGYVLVNSRPDETVMDGWTGLGVFRPHAWFFYFLHPEMRKMITKDQLESLYQDLRTGRVVPRIILFDQDLSSLSPEITDFFKQHYTSVGLPHIWVRKTGG
jgi:4-amino-4-deoxy-L-arabinose transferase-like glycosyltransferase